MSDEDESIGVGQVLTVLVVFLFLFAAGMFVLGEYLVAGVTFLSLSFALYLRETW